MTSEIIFINVSLDLLEHQLHEGRDLVLFTALSSGLEQDLACSKCSFIASLTGVLIECCKEFINVHWILPSL